MSEFKLGKDCGESSLEQPHVRLSPDEDAIVAAMRANPDFAKVVKDLVNILAQRGQGQGNQTHYQNDRWHYENDRWADTVVVPERSND